MGNTIGGRSGGGILVALLLALHGFSVKPAIAISSFATFISTVSSFFVNFRIRHPEKPNVTLVDYGITSVMMSTTLAGAELGAIVFLMFPSSILIIGLTLLLVVLCVQTIFKAI